MAMAVRGYVLFLLVLLSVRVLVLHASKTPELKNYQVVQPRKLFAQHKRDTMSNFPDVLHYGFHLDGDPLVLHLERTEDLISNNYTETHYLPDGTPVTTSPDYKDHCYYHGTVKNDSDSLVSISACKGLSGMIHTRGRRYLIEPLNMTTNNHAVYEDRDSTKTCGVTNTTWTEGKFTKSSRTSSYAKFQKYKQNKDMIRKRVFEIIHFVNLVYKAINIYVAVTGLEIWNNADKFQVSKSADVNLKHFSAWRKYELLPRKQHDNAQFITNIDFTGATVGLAYVGTLCSNSYSTGVIQDYNRASIKLGATIAHEMGHNLGMDHDSDACSCSSGPCIMAPSISYKTPFFFSSCSYKSLRKFILDRMPLCMEDKPNPLDVKTPSICGNNLKEVGEECDCGKVEECTNPCCNAATCKMKSWAECAEGECCKNCRLVQGGVVCRASKNDCDLPDVCDGTSGACPSDRFRFNGSPCKKGAGICYNGKCPTRQEQCEALFGASTVEAEDSCYKINLYGVEHGNCGKSGNEYIPCAAKDVKCGLLYCYGGHAYSPLHVEHVIFSKCKTVIHKYGLVENGTKCGDGMVCQNSKCRSIRSAYRSSSCSKKCPGHAVSQCWPHDDDGAAEMKVCDHEMKCQCEEGWAPPNCDSAVGSNITMIAVVVIIAVIAVIAIALLVKFHKGKQRKHPPAIYGSTDPTFKCAISAESTTEVKYSHLLEPKVYSRLRWHKLAYGVKKTLVEKNTFEAFLGVFRQ